MASESRGDADGEARKPSKDSAVNLDQTPWQEISRQIAVETDPVRLLELCRQLDEIMRSEEREKVRSRLKKSA